MFVFAIKKAPKVPLVIYSSNVSAGFPSPADDHTENKLDLDFQLKRKTS